MDAQATDGDPEQGTSEELGDFSLVVGGPVYRSLQRLRLVRPPLELLPRRIAFAVVLTWLPLLVLTLIDGAALGEAVPIPFFHDIAVHVRLLLVVPLLIYAELPVHLHLRGVLRGFSDHGLLPPQTMPRFRRALGRALRLRDSIVVEAALLVFVLVSGGSVASSYLELEATSWWGHIAPQGPELTPAGSWFAHVSLPFVQFLLLRWFYRMLVWSFLLWRLSRFELVLLPAHPDRAGGLGFLGDVSAAFAPFVFALSSMISGIAWNRIVHAGQTLDSMKVEIGSFAGLMMVIVIGPLCVFAPKLLQAKRRGTGDYGRLAARYSREFDRKWMSGAGGRDEALLGSADIQSLADLENSFAVVRRMRVVPFGLDTVLPLVLAVAAPLLPLVLSVVPLAELLKGLVRMLL